MNWIILLLAGLFEVSLTFCLGKTRAASGIGFYLWGSGFLASTILSMALLVAFGYGIRHLDRHRGGRHGLDRNIRFQGTCHSHPAFLPVHTHCFLDWIESRIILRGGGK